MHGGPGFAMDREEVNFYFRNHTRTPEDLTDPEIYLLKAELHGPPPAFLVVPDRDIIAADSFEMVERLRGPRPTGAPCIPSWGRLQMGRGSYPACLAEQAPERGRQERMGSCF